MDVHVPPVGLANTAVFYDDKVNESQGTILLVEDDRNDVFFLQYAFETAGITNPLQVVVDGQEAIQYLAGQGPYADRNRYPLPCLILLDLKLPVRMGLEVLEWMHARPEVRNLLVVVLTSSSNMADVDRAYQLGARSFLVKPLSVDKRLEMARLIKEYWIELNKAPSRGGCTTPENPTTSARAGHAGGTSPGE